VYDNDELPIWISTAYPKGSPLNKIWKFLSYDKVIRTAKGYSVKPLTEENYNKTERHLTWRLECDCQGFHTNGWCLHQFMVYVWRVLSALRGKGFHIVNARKVIVHTSTDPVGDHNHCMQFVDDRERWECSCDGFHYRQHCSHISEFLALMSFNPNEYHIEDYVHAEHETAWMNLDLSLVTHKVEVLRGVV